MIKKYMFPVSLAAAAGASFYVVKKQSNKECGELTVDWTKIRSNKVKTSYKLVFLTDLHDHEFGMHSVNIRINNRPQIVAVYLTGGVNSQCENRD